MVTLHWILFLFNTMGLSKLALVGISGWQFLVRIINFSLLVSPQDINKHVKTSVNNISGAVHYMAPESGLLCYYFNNVTIYGYMLTR